MSQDIFKRSFLLSSGKSIENSDETTNAGEVEENRERNTPITKLLCSSQLDSSAGGNSFLSQMPSPLGSENIDGSFSFRSPLMSSTVMGIPPRGGGQSKVPLRGRSLGNSPVSRKLHDFDIGYPDEANRGKRDMQATLVDVANRLRAMQDAVDKLQDVPQAVHSICTSIKSIEERLGKPAQKPETVHTSLQLERLPPSPDAVEECANNLKKSAKRKLSMDLSSDLPVTSSVTKKLATVAAKPVLTLHCSLQSLQDPSAKTCVPCQFSCHTLQEIFDHRQEVTHALKYNDGTLGAAPLLPSEFNPRAGFSKTILNLFSIYCSRQTLDGEQCIVGGSNYAEIFHHFQHSLHLLDFNTSGLRCFTCGNENEPGDDLVSHLMTCCSSLDDKGYKALSKKSVNPFLKGKMTPAKLEEIRRKMGAPSVDGLVPVQCNICKIMLPSKYDHKYHYQNCLISYRSKKKDETSVST